MADTQRNHGTRVRRGELIVSAQRQPRVGNGRAARIIGPMTAMATIEHLRSELEFARAATQRQRAASKSARQLLARLESRLRAGDRDGVVWLVQNWREVLGKWADETKERKR